MNEQKLRIGKYSLGMGDRFAREAVPQLEACRLAAVEGIHLVPVWNKSNREHLIVGSEPGSVLQAARKAVQELGWKGEWHVDADHIRLDTVGQFLDCSDFFTIDVAESIGGDAEFDEVENFICRHPELSGNLEIAGASGTVHATSAEIGRIARKFLPAVREAAAIFRRIEGAKGAGNFIAEVSMDETDTPQTPLELLVILAALADERVCVQTIAPKFTGRFNKGVDYVGDVAVFEREFNDDICVIAHAIKVYGLPDNLKLSVHSGSDKFSIYPAIKRALEKHDAGVHLKTAGTTWLEEVIGLAESGGGGLSLAKEIYAGACEHIDELCAPYATVIDIDRSKLPASEVVAQWQAEQFAAALRHDQGCPEFNPHMRQLIHVGFKMAAKKGERYLECIDANHTTVAKNVTANLLRRHIMQVFPTAVAA